MQTPFSSLGKSPRGRDRSFDRDLDRFRQLLVRLEPGERNPPSVPLDEVDTTAEALIAQVFGEASDFLETYQFARVGEAGSLLNVQDEAQEEGAHDPDQEGVRQRQRVLESCIWELERRRAVAAQRIGSPVIQAPRVSDYMSENVRSIHQSKTLHEAGKLLQKYKIGLLFVDDDKRYVGVITESGLSRNAVAKGLDPTTTLVKTVMSRKVVSIEDNEPIVEAVKLMKEHGIRHLAVTKDNTVVGLISISDIVRYYSGVV